MNFLLGILNSKLIDYYFKLLFMSTHMSQGYIRYDIPYLQQLPIKTVSENKQKELINLVDKMLSLNKNLNQVINKPHDRIKIEKEIKETDDKINEIVYKLYNITDEEKKIIEESLNS